MAGRKKVSFLVSNLASNSVGAVVRMARYLEPEFDVEIVGPCLWGEPNAMYRREFEFKVVEAPRVYRFPEFFAGVRAIADAAEGDVVVAMKALAPALSAARAWALAGRAAKQLPRIARRRLGLEN